jgi:hypothetical protein
VFILNVFAITGVFWIVALVWAFTNEPGARALRFVRVRNPLGARAVPRSPGNLAYRWFCGLGPEDKVPDHSVFSRARNERFVCAPQTHSPARSTTSTGPEWCAVRVHPGCDRTEPEAPRQHCRPTAGNRSWRSLMAELPFNPLAS